MFLSGGLILGRYIDDTIGIDVKSHFDLRNPDLSRQLCVRIQMPPFAVYGDKRFGLHHIEERLDLILGRMAGYVDVGIPAVIDSSAGGYQIVDDPGDGALGNTRSPCNIVDGGDFVVVFHLHVVDGDHRQVAPEGLPGGPVVERNVQYLRESFFRGETWLNLDHVQREALRWCLETAGTRIHGLDGVLKGIRDVFRHWGLTIRTSTLALNRTRSASTGERGSLSAGTRLGRA